MSSHSAAVRYPNMPLATKESMAYLIFYFMKADKIDVPSTPKIITFKIHYIFDMRKHKNIRNSIYS